MWHSITYKGEVVSFGTKNPFFIDFGMFFPSGLVSTLLCTHVGDRKTSFVLCPSNSMRWHPSKLMGCNHHHKYTVTHPTARSWLFNSKSMGCKDWQAQGNTISQIISDSELEWEENHKIFPLFRISKYRLGGLQRRNIFQMCMWHPVDITDAIFGGTYQHCHLAKYFPLNYVTHYRHICCVVDSFSKQPILPSSNPGSAEFYLSPPCTPLDMWWYRTSQHTGKHTRTQTTPSAPGTAALQEDCPWSICVFW